MSFAKRRSKLSRAQLRPTNPIALQQGRVARQRDRLARLAIVGVAVLATAAIVHGSGPRSPSGSASDRPVRSGSTCRSSNGSTRRRRTPNARPRSTRFPPRWSIDPAPLRDLSERLDDLTVAIAKAPSLDALPENLRATWRLRNETFEELKAATDTPERRDALHLQIVKAFAPLLRDGVLGYDTLPRHEESSRTLAVRGPGQSPKESHRVARERVVPERIAKPEGAVYKEFVAAFSDTRVGPLLFHLIAEKLAGTPTLTYEEQYTTTQRELARGRVEDVYDTYRQGDVLLDQDQKIEEEQLILLRLEHDKASGSLSIGERIRRVGSMILLVAALFALVGYYVIRHEPELARDSNRVAAALRVGRDGHGLGPLAGNATLGCRADPRGDRGDDHCHCL